MGEKALGFGVDVGGSGVKGAVVDLATGQFVGERALIATPQPATPAAIAEVVAQIVGACGWDGPCLLYTSDAADE